MAGFFQITALSSLLCGPHLHFQTFLMQEGERVHPPPTFKKTSPSVHFCLFLMALNLVTQSPLPLPRDQGGKEIYLPALISSFENEGLLVKEKRRKV